VFTGSGPTLKQIHELHFPFHGPDTSPSAPSGPIFGPFWTGPVPDASVKGSPFAAMMTLDYADQQLHDAFTFGGTPELLTAKATVHAEWTPGTVEGLLGAPVFDGARSYAVRNSTAVFQGVYSLAQVHVDFSFTSQVSATDKTPFTFTTNPEGQRLLFAQVGFEMNGLFFR
jgi:hypothetical protein